nr:MAG TPA: hypothetical protein [Caudoviricetes sp.]
MAFSLPFFVSYFSPFFIVKGTSLTINIIAL